MPTVLQIHGWRLYFFANELNEPVHIHCDKAEIRCKFWLEAEEFNLRLEYALNASPRDLREIKKIVYEHFDLIMDAWNKFEERKHGKAF
ncbi:MAG: DUF4160 domain-containing protein [bacterium]